MLFVFLEWVHTFDKKFFYASKSLITLFPSFVPATDEILFYQNNMDDDFSVVVPLSN
jgi:hypothetical protein